MARLQTLARVSALALVAPVAAMADTVELDVVHAWGGHARFHEPIAAAFMEQHDGVQINFRAPLASYTEGHQTILRQSLSGDLPDIWYSPYNQLGELAEALEARGDIVDLTPMMHAEGEAWITSNYAPNVLALGQVDGTQWGIPFNASTPIVYYNLDLIAEAGRTADPLPTSWDEMIELGAAISDTADDVDGIAYSVSEWGDDWLWQALIFSHGGALMNEERTEVLFGGDAGAQAVATLARLANETGMPLLSEEQTVQQFAAGKLGVFIGSTAEVRMMGELVGDSFEWRTGPFPIAAADGGLPTGGNVAVILSQDPAEIEAAWEFVKFATGPEGQMITVLGSGYMPTNLQTASDEYLGEHYADNPDWTTSMQQWPVAQQWFGYPGNSGVRIWREQQGILASIIRGDVAPDAGLEQLVSTTESLLDN
ncbi:ABC transporter substrate-binding protein [Pontivivens ytuae]|uniref:ABC transporter substrate-binding protein n=1 Tax=Pontivivens ytuae TaxID=2789856 RepID=A0A7S9LT23_9RHOB|nr:ABC transporter substrate-binding protein [Pontivivens ytuae]QPH54782.1 ABC transporter substrate-binding protein [Pontivivens ytuae]